MKFLPVSVLALLISAVSPMSMAARYRSVHPGGSHTCAITEAGRTVCWGKNTNGQLGIGSSGIAQPRLRPVAGGAAYARLTAGANHTCVMTADGTVECWGYNAFGQLGNKSLVNSATPVKVQTAVKFV